jgi:hypothetical protein
MIESDSHLRMEVAIRDQHPCLALATLAKTFKAEGMSQFELYRLFDDFRDRHELDHSPAIYDAIMDTMDIIAGWCPPGAQLFGSGLRA